MSNALNQYTTITRSAFKNDFVGTAGSSDIIKVNGVVTQRQGPWWRAEVTPDTNSLFSYAAVESNRLSSFPHSIHAIAIIGILFAPAASCCRQNLSQIITPVKATHSQSSTSNRLPPVRIEALQGRAYPELLAVELTGSIICTDPNGIWIEQVKVKDRQCVLLRLMKNGEDVSDPFLRDGELRYLKYGQSASLLTWYYENDKVKPPMKLEIKIYPSDRHINSITFSEMIDFNITTK